MKKYSDGITADILPSLPLMVPTVATRSKTQLPFFTFRHPKHPLIDPKYAVPKNSTSQDAPDCTERGRDGILYHPN